ncbi:UPF0182 family protein [Aurantimonas sp. HBX-1]|uniref:UPF0182 family protein n=1 Tax=Aurantimonas sp. HBX-1 TaxID=2906072 RepID=UPI001F157A26|nr:UPF0182 family protein [Aurantimonas sp. HBX-1]UIJ73340.1 UPF0182 family protein [Aurantimonas sp. HBX-1]
MTMRTWIAIRAFIFFVVGQLTGHVLLTVIVIVAGLLLLLFSVWAYTEVLWYDAIGYLDVLITVVIVQLGMAAAPFATMAVFVIVNMNLARKLAPLDRVISADETRVDWWRRASAPFARPLITTIGLLCGLIIALQTFVHWDTFLLWWHGDHWGRNDPQFERDLSYFMFRLAFYTLVQRWTFIGILVTLVLTVLTSYLFGGIRPQAPGSKIPFRVNLHISALMLALMVVIGWGMILELHLLSYSERGVITGLGFTDSNASLVAYKFVATAVVTGFFLFQVNIRRPGWIIPTLALVWLFLIGLSIARFYPNAYQFLVVEPQELEREYPFIEDHLAFTRYGFDLDKVERRQTPGDAGLTAAELAAYRPALEQIRLWDPDTMIINFRELQALRTYFDFEDVDVDRYRIDGKETLVLVGAREVKTRHLAESAHRWENQRMIYTHGHGLVAASGTQATEAGMPVFLTRDLPTKGASAINAENPRIYYGEASSSYAFVASDAIELDRPIDASSHAQPSGAPRPGENPPPASKERDCPKEQTRSGGRGATADEAGAASTEASDACRPAAIGFAVTDYGGKGGVLIDDIVKRLVFAIRFWDVRFALTWLVDDNTRVQFHRRIRERIERVAPFLELDRNPYPVAVDGRIKWIVDAYTVSDMMPYSRRVNLSDLSQVTQPKQDAVSVIIDEFTSSAAGLTGTANYIRGSVKAVLDAYDGSVTLYVVGPDDKVLQAWQRAFPGVFVPEAEASPALRAHFRYPQDLFRIQSAMWSDYHMETPEIFYTKEAAWRIPPDAAFISLRRERKEPEYEQRRENLRPYWLMARFPGEETTQFAIVQPFSPAGRNLLSGYLVGLSDGANYGRLVSYAFPPTRTILGPAQAQARIDQDARISAWMTLRMQSGSRVSRGRLIALPVADALLYVEPLFVQADKSSVSHLLGAQLSSIPEMKKIVVVFGDRVVMRDTLEAAIAAAFGQEPHETPVRSTLTIEGAGPDRLSITVGGQTAGAGDPVVGDRTDIPMDTP